MCLGYFLSLVYTAKKFSEKKLLKISVLNFGTKKVPCKKNPLKWSPTILRLYFIGLFFWFQYDFIQKRPRKRPIIAEYAWEQHAKRGAVDIEKRPWLYSKYRCIEKSLRHFLQNYISCDLTLRLYISSPYSILGKSPRN